MRSLLETLKLRHHCHQAIRQEDPTDKVVLASNYTEALELLGKMCAANQWQTLKLDGGMNVQKRQPLIDRHDSRDHSAACHSVFRPPLSLVLSSVPSPLSTRRCLLTARFNSAADPAFVLLLSSKAGGTGLNIIGANRLVLLDPGGVTEEQSGCMLKNPLAQSLASSQLPRTPTSTPHQTGTPPTTARPWLECGAKGSSSRCGSTGC